MMQTMRNSAKIIFFIVLVTFVGFMAYGGVVSLLSGKNRAQGGAAPPGVIGIINGQQIAQTDFDTPYRNRIQALTKDDHEPTDAEMEQARNDVWNNITTMTLLQQEAKKHGILVTDAEVADYMRQAPPKEIYESKDFATNGKFDLNKYQQWLIQMASSSDPRAQTVISDFEGQIRQQLLITRLQDFVLSNVRITEDDAKENYIDKNDSIDVQYIFIPAGDFDSTVTTVPESEIQARYAKDKEQFKQPETAVLNYVQLTKTPSEADLAEAKASIDSIYQQLLAGAIFDTLASQRSEDPGSAAKGGDLGWFGQGRMVPEFWTATSSLKNIGDISAPFKSQYGWHIVKLTGKRTAKAPDGTDQPEYQASHILIMTQASAATTAQLEQQMNNLKVDAEKTPFAQVATDYGLKVDSTRAFPKGSNVPTIGQNVALNNFAFTGKPGEFSDIVDTRNALYLCQINKVIPAGYTPYNDIKDRIKSVILREKQAEMAQKRGQELADQMSSGKTFEDIAAISGKPILETGLFSRMGPAGKAGYDQDFIGAAFALSPSKPISKAVKSRMGSYIIKYMNHKPADMTLFTAQADSLTGDLVATKKKDVWSRWINSLKQTAKIDDYRSAYYGS